MFKRTTAITKQQSIFNMPLSDLELLLVEARARIRSLLEDLSAPDTFDNYLDKHRCDVFELDFSEYQANLILSGDVEKMDLSLLCRLTVKLFKGELTEGQANLLSELMSEEDKLKDSDLFWKDQFYLFIPEYVQRENKIRRLLMMLRIMTTPLCIQIQPVRLKTMELMSLSQPKETGMHLLRKQLERLSFEAITEQESMLQRYARLMTSDSLKQNTERPTLSGYTHMYKREDIAERNDSPSELLEISSRVHRVLKISKIHVLEKLGTLPQPKETGLNLLCKQLETLSTLETRFALIKHACLPVGFFNFRNISIPIFKTFPSILSFVSEVDACESESEREVLLGLALDRFDENEEFTKSSIWIEHRGSYDLVFPTVVYRTHIVLCKSISESGDRPSRDCIILSDMLGTHYFEKDKDVGDLLATSLVSSSVGTAERQDNEAREALGISSTIATGVRDLLGFLWIGGYADSIQTETENVSIDVTSEKPKGNIAYKDRKQTTNDQAEPSLEVDQGGLGKFPGTVTVEITTDSYPNEKPSVRQKLSRHHEQDQAMKSKFKFDSGGAELQASGDNTRDSTRYQKWGLTKIFLLIALSCLTLVAQPGECFSMDWEVSDMLPSPANEDVNATIASTADSTGQRINPCNRGIVFTWEYTIVSSNTTAFRRVTLPEGSPETTTVCAGDNLQALCVGGEVIAVQSVNYGTQLTATCGLNDNSTGCYMYLYDGADWFLPTYSGREQQAAWLGESLRSVVTIVQEDTSSCGGAYPILSHYHTMRYYCIQAGINETTEQPEDHGADKERKKITNDQSEPSVAVDQEAMLNLPGTVIWEIALDFFPSLDISAAGQKLSRQHELDQGIKSKFKFDSGGPELQASEPVEIPKERTQIGTKDLENAYKMIEADLNAELEVLLLELLSNETVVITNIAPIKNSTGEQPWKHKERDYCSDPIQQATGYCLVMAKVKNQTSEWAHINAVLSKVHSALLYAVAIPFLGAIHAMVSICMNQMHFKLSIPGAESDSKMFALYIWLMNAVGVESSHNGYDNDLCLKCHEICDPNVVKQPCESYCRSFCTFDHMKVVTSYWNSLLIVLLLTIVWLCLIRMYRKQRFHMEVSEGHEISNLSYDKQTADIVPEHYQTQLDPEKVTRTHKGDERIFRTLNCPSSSLLGTETALNDSDSAIFSNERAENVSVVTEYEDNIRLIAVPDNSEDRTALETACELDGNSPEINSTDMWIDVSSPVDAGSGVDFLQTETNVANETRENIEFPVSNSACPLTDIDWKIEKKIIKSLRTRVVSTLSEETYTHSRGAVTEYTNIYQHEHLKKKSEDEDDCHALRRVIWLSHEDLPIPSLDLTVAIVHSQAQKILERLAKGEHVGAHESMKYEILRVCTYRNYPGEGKPFRIQMAGAGWYFASDGDEVVCYCCGLRKSGWQEIDNPMKVHELLRPTCDFLVKRSEVNIPVPELSEVQAARFNIFGSSTTDSESSSRQGEGANNYDAESSSPQNRLPPPKHPQYAELSVRLETFRKWPTNIPQTAQIMAECGYYYAGFGDCVRCYHCGIGLRHWTEDDYPWVEHARWSKDCAYLRHMKGDEFVQNVHLAIDNDEEPEDLVPETPSGRPADMSQVTPNEDSNQLLLTDQAQSVLTMGYQPRIIKRAIDIILHNEGKSGITAQKIMETIFMLEERDEARNQQEDATTHLQEGLAKVNISSASGGPDTQLKDAANTERNAATGQSHGRTHSQGNGKTKHDKKKDAKPLSKGTRNDKEESKKSPQNNDEASAHADEEEKSKVKDTSKIKAENRKLKEQTVCKICLDKPVSIVFLPCGHLVTCAECAPAMRKCPICRALVKGQVKAFMS